MRTAPHGARRAVPHGARRAMRDVHCECCCFAIRVLFFVAQRRSRRALRVVKIKQTKKQLEAVTDLT
jgi:hypothetical protein